MKTVLSILLALGMSSAYSAEPEMDPVPPASEKSQAATPATPAQPADPASNTPATPATPAEPAMPRADVARSQFTTAINGREPVDDLNNLDNTNETAFFFTEIRGGKGQVITHEWWHNGEMMADVDFNVNGNRWRVWSSKDFVPEWTGEWTVRVVDEAGQKLAEQSFRYTPAPASPDGGDDMSPAMMDAEPVAEPAAMNQGNDKGNGEKKDDDDGGM